MKEIWRNQIYDSYISNIFEEAHSRKNEMELQFRYYKRNYLRYLSADKRAQILELGTGMGHFYNFCMRSGYRNYAGIDLSSENIAYIKKIINPKARVRQAEICDFLKKAKRETYDAVILNDVIEHLTKDEIFEVLYGVKEILKKNGVFLIKTLNMANPFVSTAGRYIVIDHESGFTETSMKEVLRICGYKDISIVGTDVYVLNPFISLPAKLVSKMINRALFLLSALYGRTSLHIFEKDILAIAYKK